MKHLLAKTFTKTLICLILAAAPLLANADHHRSHAVMHIDDSLRFLDAALVMAERDRNAATGLEVFHLNKYLIYAGKYRDRIVSARELLVTGGNIDDVRRLISAPGFGGESESADYGLAATTSILAAAAREGADIDLILTRHSKAAQSFGWAHWHVIDAIREEIYEDPVFICSGPGNHCG